MHSHLRNAGLAAIFCGLILAASDASAAGKKPRAGITRSGGSTSTSTTSKPGGGGGNAVATTTLNITLFGGYYGAGGSGSTVATGLATLTYDATQTTRSVTVTAANVNLPDGTLIHFTFADNGLTSPTAYYPIWANQHAGDAHLASGKATLVLNTAAGDAVPLLGTAGTITVTATNSSGVPLGTVVSGSYSTLPRQGGRP